MSTSKVLPAMQFPPPELSAEETARLETVAAELREIDARLQAVADIRETAREAANDYALGKITAAEAITLGAAAFDPRQRAEIKSWLHKPLKLRRRELSATVADVVGRVHDQRIRFADAKAASLEESEREAAADLGITGEDFEPSETLVRGKRLKIDPLPCCGLTRHAVGDA